MHPSIAFQESSKKLIDAIAYSCINYAILLPLIIKMERSEIHEKHPDGYLLFYVFILLIFPVIVAFTWQSIRSCEKVLEWFPHPTNKAWDFVFSQREKYWVKVTLKNGDIVAGLYAEKSFTSSAPSPEEIYLQEEWLLDESGGFKRSIERSAGVLLLSSDIARVDLRKYDDRSEEG